MEHTRSDRASCGQLPTSAHAQELLALVRTKQRELEEQHERGKTITRSDEMRDLRDAMQQKMDDVQTLVKQVKDRLEALDKANAVALKKKVCTRPVCSSHAPQTLLFGPPAQSMLVGHRCRACRQPGQAAGVTETPDVLSRAA